MKIKDIFKRIWDVMFEIFIVVFLISSLTFVLVVIRDGKKLHKTISPVEKCKIDSITKQNDSIIIKVNNLDSIKDAKIIEVKSLDNDSTLKLFYKLIGK